jgi:hypothetical protein
VSKDDFYIMHKGDTVSPEVASQMDGSLRALLEAQDYNNMMQVDLLVRLCVVLGTGVAACKPELHL